MSPSTPRRRLRAVVVIIAITAIAVIAMTALPFTTATAAGSGGWNPIGHGTKPPDPALTGKVQTFTSAGKTVYVGGDFIDAGGLAKADHIASWDGTAWSA